MYNDYNCEAFFDEIEYYRITVSGSDGGTVTIDGASGNTMDVIYRTSVTIEAHPDVGYVFRTWECNGAFVSGGSSIDVVVNENKVCYAYFEDSTEPYGEVQVVSSPAEGGTVFIDGETTGVTVKYILLGDRVTIIANSNTGHRFDRWICNGEEYTNSRWTFTITDETPYVCTAFFEQNANVGGNTGGGNEGGNNTGSGNTSGDNTGGNTSSGNNEGGDNTGTGGETGGDNTGGDNTGTGGETGGDNTGGDNTGGDNTGGENTGGNTGDDTSGGDVPSEDGDGENKDNEKDDEKDDEKKDDKKDESSDESNDGTVAVPDTGANTNGFGGGMAGIIIALPAVVIVLISLNFASREVHHIKFN